MKRSCARSCKSCGWENDYCSDRADPVANQSADFVDDVAICAVDADCDAGQTCEYYPSNPANGALSYDNCI